MRYVTLALMLFLITGCATVERMLPSGHNGYMAKDGFYVPPHSVHFPGIGVYKKEDRDGLFHEITDRNGNPVPENRYRNSRGYDFNELVDMYDRALKRKRLEKKRRLRSGN